MTDRLLTKQQCVDRWIWGTTGMVNERTHEQSLVATNYVSSHDYDQLKRQYAAAVKASSASASHLLRLRELCQEIFGD